MIYVLLANGFEEIEALTPVDVLRRANYEVKTVAVGENPVVGSHGIPVVADITAAEATEVPALLVLPGGMPGSKNLDESPFVDEMITRTLEGGGRVAAICAAPMILGKRGLLRGKNATCFPGFEEHLEGAGVFLDVPVVTDGRFTTSNGMPSALAFANELVSLLDEGA